MTANKVIACLLIISACCCSLDLNAQKKSKAQLEKEKKENAQRISEAQKILIETETEKKTTLGQLKAINHEIDARQALINSINQEIVLLNGEIGEINEVTTSLQKDLKALKKEYADMIYQAYKVNQGYDKITFLFSAQTFNQLFLRLKYLEQYADARQLQVDQIEIVSLALTDQKKQLVGKKNEQNKLLSSKVKENKNLVSLQNKQNDLFQDLTKKEKQLRKELAERKEAVDRLDKLIADIIKTEIEKAKKSKETNSVATNTAVAVLSSTFESSINKLSWPVKTGFVSDKFGKHPHPILKNILVENQGVDIQTQKDADVTCVFEGKVATTAFVPGMNSVVIVQHGDYFTLYAKLKTVNVKKGQIVKVNQSLGTVFTDLDGVSELQFQVWKGNVKLDPEKWLSVK